MQLIIKNGRILQNNGSFLKGSIGIDQGKIAALWYGAVPELKSGIPSIDAENYLVSPGLLDTHIHGGLGFTLAGGQEGKQEDCHEGSWEKLEERLSSIGVTSILATCESLPAEKTLAFIARTLALAKKTDKVDIIGIHLEGPYLNKNKKGCHWEEFIRIADKNEIAQLLERAGDNVADGSAGGPTGNFIKVWTLAPEFSENMAAIETIASAGVSVSIAHTEADYPTAKAAFQAGANRITHTFNAMPAINHRYEGLISAAWQHGAFMELIADGLHVSPTIMKMFLSATDGGKIVLVSDNNELSGMDEGEYLQYGHKLLIKNSEIRLPEGNLAGSYGTLNRYAHNLTLCGISAGAALKTVSENPARSAGVFDRKGSIAPGKDADLVILDEQFNVRFTIKSGKLVFQKQVNQK